MTNRDYLIRTFVIILALIFPFICLSYGETRESLSKYFDSSLLPLYIISNTLTAYLLYSLEKFLGINMHVEKTFIFCASPFSPCFVISLTFIKL